VDGVLLAEAGVGEGGVVDGGLGGLGGGGEEDERGSFAGVEEFGADDLRVEPVPGDVELAVDGPAGVGGVEVVPALALALEGPVRRVARGLLTVDFGADFFERAEDEFVVKS